MFPTKSLPRNGWGVALLTNSPVGSASLVLELSFGVTGTTDAAAIPTIFWKGGETLSFSADFAFSLNHVRSIKEIPSGEDV